MDESSGAADKGKTLEAPENREAAAAAAGHKEGRDRLILFLAASAGAAAGLLVRLLLSPPSRFSSLSPSALSLLHHLSLDYTSLSLELTHLFIILLACLHIPVIASAFHSASAGALHIFPNDNSASA